MKCRELIKLLNETAEPSLAADWDNPGLLVGDEEKQVSRVLIAVDATDEVIDEAFECRADMIITHHPLIFKGIKRVTQDDFTGRRIIRLIQNDMVCFAMHTNFDVSCMGDEAAERLGLINTKVLQKTSEDEGFGRVGELKEAIAVHMLCENIKENFGLDGVKVFGDLLSMVKRVAVMPGSGSSAIEDAVREEADVLITGDIGHHDGIDAVAKGVIVIDAGHFGIEKIFMDYMKEYLERNAKGIKVFCDDREEPFRMV